MKKTYAYDPHFDPELQWSSKTEHTSFDIETVSLHVHEKIDSYRIISQLLKEKTTQTSAQPALFDTYYSQPILTTAIEFYKHSHQWSNRLIAGDSLLVMNSLIEKESMVNKVQMVYFDPPYGIKYGSNFQPFVNKRDVKDKNDADLTREPEMIKAFRDTWELGIHSYLSYLRDRLLLARELLSDSGSCFVQISDENVHLVRCLMDEVFGRENFVNLIPFRKKSPQMCKGLTEMYDYLVWYTKDKLHFKFNQLFVNRKLNEDAEYRYIDEGNGKYSTIKLQTFDMKNIHKVFRTSSIVGTRKNTEKFIYEMEINGKKYKPISGFGWNTSKEGVENLLKNNRLKLDSGLSRMYKTYFNDFPYEILTNTWDDTASAQNKIYVVQTSEKVIQRCMLMTTDPGDLVLDITCGSGTTAYVAEQWGRRWITCDTSRIAITLAKQRLISAVFEYYQLAQPNEGIACGFVYKTVPHITLKSIANNEPPATETLYDQPLIDKTKVRVCSPFTLETVPAPIVKNLFLTDSDFTENELDNTITRSGNTAQLYDWIDKLKRVGIRGKSGDRIQFSRLDIAVGTSYIHAEGLTREAIPKKVYVVFGQEHSPLEKRYVEEAIKEAKWFKQPPDLLLLCAFQIDSGVDQSLQEMPDWEFKVLKIQMNIDLQTEDLKKSTLDDSFWLVGQPDVILNKLANGMFTVEVLGFDYYSSKEDKVISGNKNDIAMWMVDTDFDGRCVYPAQLFFPMAGNTDGWHKVGKVLKAHIDEDKLELFHGTRSLPFIAGKLIAVKVLDVNGLESLKIFDTFHS